MLRHNAGKSLNHELQLPDNWSTPKTSFHITSRFRKLVYSFNSLLHLVKQFDTTDVFLRVLTSFISQFILTSYILEFYRFMENCFSVNKNIAQVVSVFSLEFSYEVVLKMHWFNDVKKKVNFDQFWVVLPCICSLSNLV